MKINLSKIKINQLIAENNKAISETTTDKTNLYILRNFTIESILPFIQSYLLDEKINPNIKLGDYGTINEELINPLSQFFNFEADYLIIALDVFQWLEDSSSYEKFKLAIETKILELLNNLSQLNKTIIINTLFMPNLPNYSFKNYSVNIETIIENTNIKIKKFGAKKDNVFVVDWQKYQRTLGNEKSLDKRFQYMSRAPYSNEFLNLYAFDISSIIKTLNGAVIKCIVLDADNTLWSGILGEDLPDGIKIGPFKYPDSCFYQFQKQLLYYKQNGLILAICSKNNENELISFLNSNQNCLIKQSDLATYRINWNPKHQNIKEIKEELNIGYESILFIDDSERELDEIKRFLPKVNVLPIPSNPLELPELFANSQIINSISSQTKIVDKTKLYQAEKKRVELKSTFQNYNEYIKSLEIELSIHQMKEIEVSRIAELTQKTNQFNLTTIRMDIGKIMQYLNSDNKSIYILSVNDKFGDSGITGAILINVCETIEIENFLMSCRILGKKIEDAFIRFALTDILKKYPGLPIIGHYVPSKNNIQVKKLYQNYNFKSCEINSIDKNKQISKYILNNINELNSEKEDLWKIK